MPRYWTAEQWSEILFSEELKFKIFGEKIANAKNKAWWRISDDLVDVLQKMQLVIYSGSKRHNR